MRLDSSSNGRGPTAHRWVIIFLSLMAYMVSMVIRYTWPPLAPVALPELNVHLGEAGVYMSAFYLGYVLTQIPAGMLADRFGVRALLTVSLIIQAGAAYLFGGIEDFQSGYPLRVISGLSGGCVYSACFKALVNWFPGRERGLAFGLLLTGPSLGLTLANVLAPGLELLWGWRDVFRSTGYLALLCALLVLGLMRDAPPSAEKPGGRNPDKSSFVAGFLSGIRFVVADYHLRLLCLGGFCYIWAFVGFVTWGNIYLKDILQLSLREAGSIMSIMAVISLLLAPVAGLWAGDENRSRKILMASSFLLMLGVLFFGRTDSIFCLGFLAVAVGVACGFMNPIYSLLVSFYTPQQWAGSAGGVTACVWQMAGVLSPVVSGWAIAGGGSFSLVWLIVAAGPAAGLLVLALLGRPKSKP